MSIVHSSCLSFWFIVYCNGLAERWDVICTLVPEAEAKRPDRLHQWMNTIQQGHLFSLALSFPLPDKNWLHDDRMKTEKKGHKGRSLVYCAQDALCHRHRLDGSQDWFSPWPHSFYKQTGNSQYFDEGRQKVAFITPQSLLEPFTQSSPYIVLFTNWKTPSKRTGALFWKERLNGLDKFHSRLIRPFSQIPPQNQISLFWELRRPSRSLSSSF